MRFAFDSCPKNQESLPVHPITIVSCASSGTRCSSYLHLPVPFGGALHRAAQVGHALCRGPHTLHNPTRGAAVAVSLMAHRHRNLSQSRHVLCRPQMYSGPLYPQPVSTRRLGILPLLLARTVVFERRKRRGMDTINSL